MTYQLLGLMHLAGIRAVDTSKRILSERSGQGSVEYVGLLLLVGAIIAAVATAGSKIGATSIPKVIAGKMKDAIESVGSSK